MDDNLYLLLIKLINKTIEHLSEEIKYFRDSNRRFDDAKSDISKRYLTHRGIIEEHIFVRKYVNRMICKIEESLQSDFNECIELFNNDPVYAGQLPYEEIILNGAINEAKPLNFIKFIIESAITEYIMKGRLDETKIESAYCNMKDFFNSDQIEFIELFPFHGFCSSEKVIEIMENVTIRKIDLDEKIRLYDKRIDPELFPYETNWVLQIKTMVKKNLKTNPRIEVHHNKSSMSIVAATITTFRLIKYGSFGTNTCVRFLDLDVPLHTAGVSNLKINGFESTSYGDYEIQTNQLNEVYALMEKCGTKLLRILDFRIEDKDALIHIKNAFSRFNYAYQRDEGSDMIVDFVIALESILSKAADPTDSLSFKLAIRGAKLLANNEYERKEKFNNIKDIYEIRSKIVHGDLKGFNKLLTKKDQNIITIHNLLSSILIKYLDCNIHEHEEIISKLDFS